MADAGGGPPPDQQPMVTAQQKPNDEVVKLREELLEARKSARTLNEQLNSRDRKIASLSKHNIDLMDENKLLLNERTMRVRYPRCVEVARRQVEIGEADDEKKQILALLKMPTDQFEATENRVEKIHKRVAVGSSEPLDTNGILGVVPEQWDEDKGVSLDGGPRAGKKQRLAPSWTGGIK